ncbi:hypothetical protein VTK56DRAFT_8415 [Thermocarpiscus australiensis]
MPPKRNAVQTGLEPRKRRRLSKPFRGRGNGDPNCQPRQTRSRAALPGASPLIALDTDGKSTKTVTPRRAPRSKIRIKVLSPAPIKTQVPVKIPVEEPILDCIEVDAMAMESAAFNKPPTLSRADSPFDWNAEAPARFKRERAPSPEERLCIPSENVASDAPSHPHSPFDIPVESYYSDSAVKFIPYNDCRESRWTRSSRPHGSEAAVFRENFSFEPRTASSDKPRSPPTPDLPGLLTVEAQNCSFCSHPCGGTCAPEFDDLVGAISPRTVVQRPNFPFSGTASRQELPAPQRRAKGDGIIDRKRRLSITSEAESSALNTLGSSKRLKRSDSSEDARSDRSKSPKCQSPGLIGGRSSSSEEGEIKSPPIKTEPVEHYAIAKLEHGSTQNDDRKPDQESGNDGWPADKCSGECAEENGNQYMYMLARNEFSTVLVPLCEWNKFATPQERRSSSTVTEDGSIQSQDGDATAGHQPPWSAIGIFSASSSYSTESSINLDPQRSGSGANTPGSTGPLVPKKAAATGSNEKADAVHEAEEKPELHAQDAQHRQEKEGHLHATPKTAASDAPEHTIIPGLFTIYPEPQPESGSTKGSDLAVKVEVKDVADMKQEQQQKQQEEEAQAHEPEPDPESEPEQVQPPSPLSERSSWRSRPWDPETSSLFSCRSGACSLFGSIDDGSSDDSSPGSPCSCPSPLNSRANSPGPVEAPGEGALFDAEDKTLLDRWSANLEASINGAGARAKETARGTDRSLYPVGKKKEMQRPEPIRIQPHHLTWPTIEKKEPVRDDAAQGLVGRRSL